MRSLIPVVVLVIMGSLLADGPVGAAMGGGSGNAAGAAAAVASAGLGGCSSNSGKTLYGCIADVLDTLSNGRSETQPALRTAASQLRAAVNKVQALSAITQCRSAIAGALREALASGRNGKGLSAIAGVLAQAARLIQTKG
jgi:hypothetical protein